MKEKCSSINLEFNRIVKEADMIYSQYAASHGISTTTMCVLYSVYTTEVACTQVERCEDWDIPRQTINSCLKVLEKAGVVEMVFVEGSRKNKHIRLTPAGEKLAERIVAPLIQCENAALHALDAKE